jgi:hypothetical protein
LLGELEYFVLVLTRQRGVHHVDYLLFREGVIDIGMVGV